MEEEEGRGVALIGHRHPNPTDDCSHRAASRERCIEGRGGKEKRREISKGRAQDEEQEEREGKHKLVPC